MLIPVLSSTGYKIVLLLHIVFVLAAFGGLFAAPILARAGSAAGATESLATAMVDYLKRFAIPSLLLAGILGIGLVAMSKPAGYETAQWSFKQGWVSGAMLLWIVQVAVYLGLLVPTQRKIAEGDESAARQMPMFTGIVHLSLLVMLYLMLFKPGA